MKAIMDFALRLDAKISLNPNLIVKKAGRYFLLNENLLGLVREDFYYAGAYLGKVKDGKFFPSFNLLAMLGKGKANKIVVNEKAAWLFICGRDIFRKGITTVHGSRLEGAYTLVLNMYGECLGFGRIISSLDADGKETEVAVKNISDVGDFLRRED
jgi:ribosome biogenesis protein Nip4